MNAPLRYETDTIINPDKLSSFDTSNSVSSFSPVYTPSCSDVIQKPNLAPSSVSGVAAKAVQVVTPTFENLSTKDEFFLISEGLPLWQVASFISKYFNINIIVYDDIKDKPIYASISGTKLKTVMNVLTWLTNSEFIEKDNIYYFGSNSQQILVLPSTDISANIEQIFTNVKAKQIEDKLVIVGNQKDVGKIKDSYNQILDRSYCVVHLYAFTVSSDRDINLGVDINKSISYAFSWESLALNSYNPIQALAVSLKASLVADEELINIQSVIDTDIGLLSGKDMLFQEGVDWDRPIYSQSQYGEQSQVISGYSTQHTGLILKLKGFNDGSGQWFVTFGIENSQAETDLKRRLTTLQTVSKLSKKNPVQMLAQLEAGESTETFEKGIPFLCDIPYIGALFRISDDRTVKKNIYFVLSLKEDSPVITDSFKKDGNINFNSIAEKISSI